ncbi:hypothetical protein AYK24_07750 [Thermoplasmatales archaeon SG8-52-4]|nr:MAG: hypothetical protein AYK24_07750 [Thermoplasmatales archaeon SG8-52-4]
MQNKKNIKNKFPSNKHTNLIKIEDIVDKIIQNNKEKLDLLNSKEINIEDFSLKNKKRDALYYIKKKTNKKSKKNNTKKLEENLKSKPKSDINKKNNNNNVKSDKKENKQTSENKKFNEIKEKNKHIDEKLKPEKTEKLLNEFNDIKDNLLPLKSNETEKFTDQKLIEDTKNKDSIEKNDTIEKKVDELTKKHGFIDNNKISPNDDKKNNDWLSSPKENLVEFKKKYEKNLIFTDFDLPEVNKLKEVEIKILDEKIKEFPIEEVIDYKENLPEKVESKPKVKRSFFKKRKSVDQDNSDLVKKEGNVESYIEKFSVEDKSLKVDPKDKKIAKGRLGKSLFKSKKPVEEEVSDFDKSDSEVGSKADKFEVDNKELDVKVIEESKTDRWNFGKSLFKSKKSVEDQVFGLDKKDLGEVSETDEFVVDDIKIDDEFKDNKVGKGKLGKSLFKSKKPVEEEVSDLDKKGLGEVSETDEFVVDDIKIDDEFKDNKVGKGRLGKSLFKSKKPVEEEVSDFDKSNSEVGSETDKFEDNKIIDESKDKKIKRGRFGKSLFKIKKSKDLDSVGLDKKNKFFQYENLEDLIPQHPIEDEEIIDQKLKEDTKIDDSIEKDDTLEKKADELAKKHGFFNNNKISPDDEKKNRNDLIFSNYDLNNKDVLSKDKDEIFDEKIKEFTAEDVIDIKEDLPEKVESKSKIKKSFFKKKKSKDQDSSDLDKKEVSDKSLAEIALVDDKNLKVPEKEKKITWKTGKGKSKKNFSFLSKEKIPKDINQKQKGIKQSKLKKPNFRVNYLTRKSEKALQDEKIKDTPVKIDNKDKEVKGESEALKLASKHLKDTSKSDNDKKTLLEQKETQESLLFNEENPDHEHVFFDEEESSSGGWSPQLSNKAKKALSLPNLIENEIGIDKLKAQDDIELPKEVLQTKSVKLTDLGFSENEWEEMEFYSLFEPFAYVEILREKESLDKCYFLVENALTEDEENILTFIEETMASMVIDTLDFENKNESDYLISKLEEVIHEYNIDIDEESKNKIFYYIGKASLGLGKIDPLMRDPNIEDISCDGADVPIFLYHRKYGSLKSNIKFDDEEELSAFVFKLAQKCGKHISIAEPMLDATMPDGSRIQMTLSDEITAKGSTFTIRKFRSDPFSPPDLVEFNTMSSEMIAFMWMAVENGINTLFAGGTASGKTTALNALTLFIPRESKIVSIEETREINLPHPNWIPGVARSGFGEVVADRVIGEIDMYDLMKAALRQRPEYILVGEIRGREAYVLFQAMATGHATYSTAHADSAQSLIHRLEGKPINIPRVMLQSLDIVCLHVITRVKNIRARRCKQIIEIIDIDPTTKEILTNEVFRWDPVEDRFVYSGKSYILERIRAEKDMTREEMTNEIKNRKLIVEWMNKNNVREFRDVSKLVSQYTESPEETLEMVKKGDKKINA